jgi:hypothetical protein
MAYRPAIPVKVQCEVLLQARHRCSACCAPTALEKAHIVPWHQTRDHSESNLVALCANCHTRSHTESWDQETLRHYKKHPCALVKERDRLPYMSRSKRALVDMIIAADFEQMTKTERKRLASVLAAYLDLPTPEISIRSVKPHNSVWLRLEAAHRLLEGCRERDPELLAFIREFSPEAPFNYIEDIRIVDDFMPGRDLPWSLVTGAAELVAFAMGGSPGDYVSVYRGSLRAVVAIPALSLVVAVSSIFLLGSEMARLRSNGRILDNVRATLATELSSDAQARGAEDRALRLAVLGARLELRSDPDAKTPQLAREQLALLASQTITRLDLQADVTRIELARLSPNAQAFFAISDDQVARVWNTVSGKEVAALNQSDTVVKTASFNQDGSKYRSPRLGNRRSVNLRIGIIPNL